MRPLLAAAALLVLVGCSNADEPEPPPDASATSTSASTSPSTSAPSGAAGEYAEYVALGDSFTAAPLVPPTDTANGCLRSGANYPALVADGLPGTTLTDVSCSAATSRDTVGSQGGTVPPQFDALGPETDLVTIGLGGNDEDLYGNMLGGCLAVAGQDPTGSPCADAAAGGPDLDRVLGRIQDNLGEVVSGVRERSPQARILLVGYPQLIPPSGTCADLPLAEGDYPFARTINHGLSDAVEGAARDTDVEFVDLWTASAGHDICADQPWINGQHTLPDAALAFHPFAVEQKAVARLVLRTIS